MSLTRWSGLISCFALLVGCSGDGNGGGDTKFISLGTAPVGGAFNQVGTEIAEALNNSEGEKDWKVQSQTTKGSQENIRKLSSGDLQLALSNSAITYFAVRGEGGFKQKHNTRAVATIAPNVAMFITKADSGIKTMQDLKGKTVVCGPAGAGFEMFLEPILKAHGLTFDDFNAKNAGQSDAVELIADNSADAAFLGGAVPTAAISQACSTHDIHFIPYDDAAMEELIDEFPFFQEVTIPQKVYSDLTGDFKSMNTGSMHFVTSADQSEDFIYAITKALWENRKNINHPASKFISEENAARYTGTEFHPGAIKFYKEAGIWQGEDAADEEAKPEEKPADTPAEPKE